MKQTSPTQLAAHIDRYQLLRVLGRGGMGVVYLASDTLLVREIALKVVDEELLGERGERLAALFQREARNLAGLNHPGIVQIFDYSGLYSSRLYLVMEYVPGRDLGELLDHSGPLPWELVAHVGVGVAGVLAYAHGHGIIHQDLKPENILVTEDGRLKLTDFGISRRLAGDAANDGRPDQSERPDRIGVAGTPAYMAPEQAMGRPVDARVDIFSLGATLYSLATGFALVEGLGPNETVAAIARGDFPAVGDRAPAVPEPLAAAISRALAIDPDRRFPDAMAFAAALAASVDSSVPKPDDIPRVPAELIPRRAAPPATAPHERVVATTMAAPIDDAATGVAPDPRLDTLAAPAPLAEASPVAGAAPTLVSRARRMARTAGERPLVQGGPAPLASGLAEVELPLLLGRFQLVRKLGSGALGEMWLAHDAMAEDELVAIKIFRPAPGASIDEFKAEFRDLASLRHPNLVRIRDFGLVEEGVARSVAFYTMDYVEGPNLRRAAAGLSLEEVYELLVQVARALVFLHGKTKRGHLSLKPENILVTSDDDGRPRVVVTDPGNPTEKLRSIHRGDRTGLPYAAPECLGGLVAGPGADLYALGVIAFELITGRRPFLERTPETLKAAHLYEAPPDLRSLREDVPAPIAEVVAELLAKEPGRRPAGPEAWIRAVNQVVVPPYPVETEATRTGRFSSAPWAGREAELKAIVDGLRGAFAPTSRAERFALVVGDPGIGKGRLLDEVKRTAQLEGAIVLEGRPASRVGRPLGPLVPILAGRYGARIDDPALTAEQRRVLRQLLGPREEDESRPASSARADTSPPAIDPGVVSDLLLRDITHPTVIMLRGGDRMDRVTIDVVARTCRALTPMHSVGDEVAPPPVFVILTVCEADLDPATKAILDQLPGVRRVELGPLDDAGVADMLRGAFGHQPLPAEALATLLRVTAGNPGDVQDVLYALIESNDLGFEDGAWRLRPGVDVPLPRSVEEAMHKRLAGLDQAQRDVLETLAVFSTPVPANIIDSLGDQAAPAVQELIERELMARRLVDDEVCLAFSHERTRVALLREMSAETRAARHREAAQWLERTRPLEQAVEALASHWSAGGRPERALSFLLEAAERAHAAGDIPRTLQWYGEALEVLPKAGMGVLRRLESEALIRNRLGSTARAAGDLESAEAHFTRLLAIGRDLEDPSWVAVAVDRLALVMIDALRFDDAVAFANQGYELALARDDVRGQAMALRLLGSVRREQSGPGAGLEDLHRALRVAGDGADLADVRARIAVTLSYGYTDAGRPAKGLQWAEWGLAIAREQGLVEMEVSLLINLSMAAFLGGMPERALDASREAMTFAEKKGLKRYFTLALGNMGDTLRVLGHFDEAEALLRAALRETYTTGAMERVVARLIELTALSLDREQPRQALPYLREAWRLLPQARGSVRLEVVLAELRLRLWSEGGVHRASSASTGELLREALAGTRDGGDPGARVRALALVATAAREANPEAAIATAREAAVLAAALPPPGILRHTDVADALSDVLEALGDAETASVLRTSAAGAIARCVAGMESASLRESFQRIPFNARLLQAGG